MAGICHNVVYLRDTCSGDYLNKDTGYEKTINGSVKIVFLISSLGLLPGIMLIIAAIGIRFPYFVFLSVLSDLVLLFAIEKTIGIGGQNRLKLILFAAIINAFAFTVFYLAI